MIFIPTIYLSPSTQEFNPYFGGGNEEQYMNLVADAMIPYLNSSGIKFVRNTPDMTAASSIRASNSGRYDFHLALHSNASNTGNARGAEFYYYPYSYNGTRAAEIFANNFKLIYPEPSLVETVATTTLGEVTRTRAPAVLAEVAYHDNPDDAEWIREKIDKIAENLVLSLTDYFGIPFVLPSESKTVTVNTPRGGNLNIREAPDIEAQIVGKAPNKSVLNVINRMQESTKINYKGVIGYVNNNFIN